jgi:hypothetical protein
VESGVLETRPLIRIIGSDDGFPERLQQSRAYSIFRDAHPQLVRANPECSRHSFGKVFLFALDEPVIVVRPAPSPIYGHPKAHRVTGTEIIIAVSDVAGIVCGQIGFTFMVRSHEDGYTGVGNLD